MAMKWLKKVILAKAEVTYGVDPVPVVATDAMLVRNVKFNPLALQYDEREYDVPFYGNKGKLIAGQYATLAFEVEMAGSSAAGTAPRWGVLHKACCMSETIVAVTSVTYAPISSLETSLAIYFRMDGRQHALLGCMGNVEAKIVAGKAPIWAYTFIGLHVQPADVALGAPTLTSFIKPLAINKANTTPFTLHAFAGKFREMSINVGNELPYRNLPNYEGIQFVDRQSVGSVRLEDELIATKDWYTIIKAGTLGALAFTQGTIAANKVSISAPNVQLTEPDISDESNIAMFGAKMDLQPSAAGNDEFAITVT